MKSDIASQNVYSDFQGLAKLRREAEHHDMSHAERRKKDRDFGRFVAEGEADGRIPVASE